MFIVRVELKDVPESKAREVYEKFHNAMANAGYSKKIKGGDGKWYKLPDATYISSSSEEIAAIRTAVKAIADKTGYNSGVIVFDGTGTAAWTGLDLVPTSSLFANA